jgi:predicted metal-dependent phosphoesterase TrpH/ADP-ribose pyrophosphatase YjhB (NUDIX family)
MVDRIKEFEHLGTAEKTILGTAVIDEAVKRGGCDLHLHTQASDGADSAARVVQKVMENKLYCFSITDHDSIEGVQDVIKILHKLKYIGMLCPRFIPGVELSVQEERELHILGYFPFGGYEKMEEFIRTQRKRRNDRNVELCRLLTEHGMPITIDELRAEGGAVVGRLHAANVLTRKGYLGSTKEAFNNWIGDGKPCYASRVKPSAKEAIESILAAGGVPVAAHPYLYEWTSGTKEVSDTLLIRLSQLKSEGLLGVEAFHGEASFAQKIEIEAAAYTLDLICTAGSDYHGDNKPGLSMYNGSHHFFHENDTVYIAAVIEAEGKIFAVRKTSGLNIGKWYLPGGRKSSGKSGKDCLSEIMKESWGIEATIKEHYTTIVHETVQQRITLITYRCDCPAVVLEEKCRDAGQYGLFSLGTLSGMDLMSPDAGIIDKLREMTFLETFSQNEHICPLY